MENWEIRVGSSSKASARIASGLGFDRRRREFRSITLSVIETSDAELMKKGPLHDPSKMKWSRHRPMGSNHRR
jgi:hypothetical protein